jgi:hypothetical protein
MTIEPVNSTHGPGVTKAEAPMAHDVASFEHMLGAFAASGAIVALALQPGDDEEEEDSDI